MKKTKIMLGMLIMLMICISSGIQLNAASLGYEEKSIIESKELINGVNYKRVDATTTNDSGTVKEQKVSVVEVEKGSAEIVAWSKYNKDGIIGATVSNIAKDYESKHPGYKVIAGINADYFNTSNYAPINAIVQDGDVIKFSNHVKYQSISFNRDGSGLIKVKESNATTSYYLTIYNELGLPIKEIILNGYNARPGTNQTTFFYKNASPLKMDGTTCFEISSPDAYFNFASMFVKGKITGVVTSLTANPIISTTVEEVANLLKTNPYVRIQKMMTKENELYQNVIGVGSQPLVDGTILQNSEIGDQNVDFCATRAPRTSIGWTKDGNIIITAIDGRQSSKGMNGVSLREEAAIMKALGCSDAFNFDGGGSTELVIRDGDSFKVTNSPSDGSSRKVSTAVLIVVPDVSYNLKVSEITKTAAKVDFSTKATSESVTNISTKLIVNGTYQNGDNGSFYITGLKEGEANFVTLEINYKLNGVSKTVYSDTTKVYTTKISDPTNVVKVKPSNFDVKFERTDSGFDAIVTCDDPSATLKKVYLVSDGQSEIAIKDIRGYVVNYPIKTSCDMNFEIKYEYNLGTMKNTSEIYSQTFNYQYVNSPSNFLVNFAVNNKAKGFDVILSYDANGCVVTEAKLNFDRTSVQFIGNKATIKNAAEKIYELTIDVTYVDGDITKTITVPGVYSYPYVNRSGCSMFNIIEIMSMITSFALVLFIIRRNK